MLADLMVEIEKAAVEKQSDLLNKVKLMEAKQERDELVRRFVASDTCNETVSHVNTTILMALVKGLVIDDTKGEVLSKMEKFDLDGDSHIRRGKGDWPALSSSIVYN